MVSTCIRKYSGDSDYDRVRTVFAAGMYSLLPRLMIQTVTTSRYVQLIAGGLIIAAATAGRVLGAGPCQLMSIIACSCVLCLATTWLYVCYRMLQYVSTELRTSMTNIEQYYDAGFWVAELDGVVVGTVGLKKVNENTAEMFRLSVLRKARGLGLAKQLVQGLWKSMKEERRY